MARMIKVTSEKAGEEWAREARDKKNHLDEEDKRGKQKKSQEN